MQRIPGPLAALALTATLAAPVAAQDMASARAFSVGVRGGVSIPVGALADDGEDGGNASTGFNVGAFLGFTPAALPVGLRVEVGYDRFGIDAGVLAPGVEFDGDWSIISGTVNAIVAVPTQGGVRPYLIGGVGAYNVTASVEASEGGESIAFSDDQTKIGVNGGAGLRFALGTLATFVEARYHAVFLEGDRASYIPISFGVEF